MRNQEDEQRVSASPFQSQESITPLTNLQTIGKRKLCLLLSVSALSSVSGFLCFSLFQLYPLFLCFWVSLFFSAALSLVVVVVVVREGVVVRFDIESRRSEERDILGGGGEREENIPTVSPHTLLFNTPFLLPFFLFLSFSN